MGATAFAKAGFRSGFNARTPSHAGSSLHYQTYQLYISRYPLNMGNACTGKSNKQIASTPSLSGFCPIPDRFSTIAEVQTAVRAAGLESSNLILGVDFTKSNTWTGAESFGGKNLHDTSEPNPYTRVIDIIGRTLETFDDDKLIPAYGFGDSTTGNKKCFPFLPDAQPCFGIKEVLNQYKNLAAVAQLSGPTCFAPVIHEAIKVVREEQGYHILVIIADGQVTDPSPDGATARAIIEASHYPLSIVVVGVGDGPWHTMEHYDDELPERQFDNFQFVEWNAVRHGGSAQQQGEAAMEARFALSALMEVPEQYAYIKHLGLLDTSNWPVRMQGSIPDLAPAPAATSRSLEIEAATVASCERALAVATTPHPSAPPPGKVPPAQQVGSALSLPPPYSSTPEGEALVRPSIQGMFAGHVAPAAQYG